MGFLAFTKEHGVEFGATALPCSMSPRDGVWSEPSPDAVSSRLMGTSGGWVLEPLVCHSECPLLFFLPGVLFQKLGSKLCCDQWCSTCLQISNSRKAPIHLFRCVEQTSERTLALGGRGALEGEPSSTCLSIGPFVCQSVYPWWIRWAESSCFLAL